MARYKDLLPSQQGWIHELARGEINPDADRLLQLGKSFDPQQLVEESTIDFLSEMRELLNEYVKTFNAYSEAGAKFQEIKVYNLAGTAADFMIFRSQIKLVVSNTSHGTIQTYFSQHVRNTLAVDGQQISQPGAGATSTLGSDGKSWDLQAQVGPFRDVYWTFQGEKVTAEQVAKFFFSEFARATRDGRRSKGNNQVLLDQIKALLQEKGLEL